MVFALSWVSCLFEGGVTGSGPNRKLPYQRVFVNCSLSRRWSAGVYLRNLSLLTGCLDKALQQHHR